MKDVLVFEINNAKGKPNNIRHETNYCPFCDTEHLTNIIDQKDDMIWLENKFRTLKDTNQTVLIESHVHDGDISNYSVQKNASVFQFAYDSWNKMLQSDKYESVLMYKNFGPMSGGSLTHPHLQIVGLDNVNGYNGIQEDNFVGINVWNSDHINLNLSEKPIMGFVEFNVVINDDKYLRDMAEFVRVTVKYVLNNFYSGRCNSYNLFFYKTATQIICKVVPRFVVSPYFVGYKLSQKDSDAQMADISKELLQQLREQAESAEFDQ